MRDWNFGTEGEFRLQECEGCGLVLLDPRPTAEEMKKFYPATYPAHVREPESHAGVARRSLVPERLKEYARALGLGYPWPGRSWREPMWARMGWGLGRGWARRVMRARLLPDYVVGGRVLDVGCGRGDYLRGLQRLGWQVQGLDVSELAVRTAQAQGIPAAQGELLTTGMCWPAASFDVITFMDSFEHHGEPRGTLAEARRLLRPKGQLLVLAPNFASPWRRLFGAHWADLAAPLHLFHYTPETLTRLVRAEGFEVEGVYRRRDAEIARSLHIWKRTRGQKPTAPVRGWADWLVGRGHCLLRARVAG
ncbi:MAG: class I SAM-dependent methyltransferase [Terriglobales bacterium]